MQKVIFISLSLLTACSNDYDEPVEPKPVLTTIASDSIGAVNEEPSDANEQDTSKQPATAIPSQTPASEPTPPIQVPPVIFKVDPDTLSFPVVFHLGTSDLWKSADSLKPVIAEIQRILSAAKIEILPQYTQDAKPSGFLDVTYVPSIPDNPGVNGISFGGADLEVFVRDKVGLSRVADNRPTDAPAVRTLPGAKPGEKITINQIAADQARTTTHEICHQLGLPHRQDNVNLMASGTTGWTLNTAEISTVRQTATRLFGAKFIATFEP